MMWPIIYDLAARPVCNLSFNEDETYSDLLVSGHGFLPGMNIHISYASPLSVNKQV